MISTLTRRFPGMFTSDRKQLTLDFACTEALATSLYAQSVRYHWMAIWGAIWGGQPLCLAYCPLSLGHPRFPRPNCDTYKTLCKRLISPTRSLHLCFNFHLLKYRIAVVRNTAMVPTGITDIFLMKIPSIVKIGAPPELSSTDPSHNL